MHQTDFVIGLDEVGRGCVAGPLVVGIVVIPKTFPLLTSFSSNQIYPDPRFNFIRDSKKLSESKRRAAANLIQEIGFDSLLISVDNQTIDKFGIGVCLSHILRLGYDHFLQILDSDRTTYMIADGKIKILNVLDINLVQTIFKQNPNLLPSTQNFDKQLVHRENFADDKYLSVALASNMAKVFRDDWMIRLAQEFPIYGWEFNKGYGTAKHLHAIRHSPDNPYLRRTFLTRQLKTSLQSEIVLG